MAVRKKLKILSGWGSGFMCVRPILDDGCTGRRRPVGTYVLWIYFIVFGTVTCLLVEKPGWYDVAEKTRTRSGSLSQNDGKLGMLI
jgi:hypothetical protein